MEPSNSVVIVTGARKGIGRFLAESYLRRGWNVVGCSRQTSDLDAQNYRHFCLDVADESAVVAMVNEVKKQHGHIDALINNAGIASMNHALVTPLSAVERLFRTNFFGSFLFCREVAKVMMPKKFGRIVNFTTVAVPIRLEGEAIYAASKSALELFTRVFAREVAGYGITCNLVGPSPIETDLIKNVPKAKMDRLIEMQARKELACPEDVLRVIDFFLDRENRHVTGQVLYLGGIG